MKELVTPPMEKALNEVGQYYKELSEKKRSRSESLMIASDELKAEGQDQNLPKKETRVEPNFDGIRENNADWAE